MPRMHSRVIAERKEHVPDRRDERVVVAARQVRSSYRPRKERIAHEQILARSASRSDLQADAAGTMPRRVVRPRVAVAEGDRLAVLVELVHGGERFDPESEQRPLLGGPLVKKQILLVKVDGDAERAPRERDARHVIHVRVRQQNASDREAAPLRGGHERRRLIARIDQNRFVRPLAADDEPVLEERPDRLRLDYDHTVILAIVDDLMFTSKIRSAAGLLGVTVGFARSADAALAEMRKNRPELVILDLNNPRTDPLGTVAAMKADPALADIPTVGFASHVQTDVIAAAREAGVGEVMARSAFTSRLPEILGRTAER